MTFKEYGPEHKTYVVVHTTGCGEQGGEPIREHEVRGSYDRWFEAYVHGRHFFPPDPSGWTYDNFTIHINTSTEKGKREEQEFRKAMERKMAELDAKMKAHPENYVTYKTDGFSVTLEYNPLFDDPQLFRDARVRNNND